MLNKEKNNLIKKIEFIENLEKQDIDREQIDLCKKFIKVNWSNNERLYGKAEEINSYLAKHVVEHLFNKYIANEAFILAAHELGYKFKVIDDKNALITYKVYYQQNAG